MGAAARSERKLGRDLTEGPIFQSLLLFAMPIVAANIIQQLYGMVDLAVAGKYVGNIGTVGVNTGGEIADMVLPVALALGSASQVLIGQQVGAKNEEEVQKTVRTSLCFCMILSVVIAAGVIIFCVPILRAINCPEEALGQARAYMIITAIGYPFIFGYNMVCGIMRGIGESKRPLLFISIAATINIFADLLLVIVFPLEAAGTAIATVLSQIGAFVAAFYYMYKARERFDIRFDRSLLSMDGKTVGVIIRLAVPQITRSLLVRFSMLWVNAGVNSYGTVASSANGVGNKILKICEVFMLSMDTSSGAMIAQNLGARKTKRAGRVCLCSLLLNLICAVLISVLGLAAAREIFGLFSNDEQVMAIGVVFMEMMIIHFFSTAVVNAFQPMATGSGFVTLSFAVGILDGVICKVSFSLLFVPLFAAAEPGSLFYHFCEQLPAEMLAAGVSAGFLGYFFASACSRILPAILYIIYYASGKWKTRKLLTETK